MRAGTSPYNKERQPLSQPDLSSRARCPVCRLEFIGFIGGRSAEDNLAAHAEEKHAIRVVTPRTYAGSADVQRVIDTITYLIKHGDESGGLKPGETVVLSELIRNLQISRYRVELAVDQLIRNGALRYEGTGTARRVVVR